MNKTSQGLAVEMRPRAEIKRTNTGQAKKQEVRLVKLMRAKTIKQAKTNKLNNVKDIVVLKLGISKFVKNMVFGSNTANAWKAELKSMRNNS